MRTWASVDGDSTVQIVRLHREVSHHLILGCEDLAAVRTSHWRQLERQLFAVRCRRRHHRVDAHVAVQQLKILRLDFDLLVFIRDQIRQVVLVEKVFVVVLRLEQLMLSF